MSNGNHNGLRTHHQLHVMAPVILATTNIINNISVSGNRDELSLLMFRSS